MYKNSFLIRRCAASFVHEAKSSLSEREVDEDEVKQKAKAYAFHFFQKIEEAIDKVDMEDE